MATDARGVYPDGYTTEDLTEADLAGPPDDDGCDGGDEGDSDHD